jgi:ATP-dependent DNA helicase RecG
MPVDLKRPVTAIPKIGPKIKDLLSKMEIKTVEDLLYHFPFRYDDYSHVKNIAEVLDGETVTLKGTLLSADNIFTKYGKRITKAKLSDDTGTMDLLWFNQHYIKSSLRVGEDYQVSGKASSFNNKLCIFSPEMSPDGFNNLHTGRLVPVYPETAGISSKWLRTRINDVLSQNNVMPEFLPQITLNKRNLNDFDTSIRSIHFPEDLSNVGEARRRFEFEELFVELLKVEARKAQWSNKLHGVKMQSDGNSEKIAEFTANLPFTLTPSQQNAVDEILKDMAQPHPMNRILEGDVGTGKTIVALTAAYFSYLNGRRTVYMAPTEILANQHYETFNKFLSGKGISIGLLTGSKKNTPENWDILIGTHAVLFDELSHENIGLVVIDEQHRFGVEQRTKIVSQYNKIEKVQPHLLTMTATPIPRTLALTLFGDLAISNLTTPPNKNKKITTTVVPEKQREQAYEMIRKKNEQTFIVCPLIEESGSESMVNVKAAEVEYENLKNGAFKGMEVGLLHGRMRPKEKQEIIEKFRGGEIKILVSTPVIEVGIDVPEATVMVIESAERYGLASLHQLRGRVGRGDKPGFCLVFMSDNSRGSYSRLKNLEKIDNGLELAEIDLKIRGQGDLYGTMQHGFKKFRIASLDNLHLLEDAKLEAQKIFPELDKYPLLMDKLERSSGGFVGSN